MTEESSREGAVLAARLAAAGWVAVIAVLLWSPGSAVPAPWPWLAAFERSGGDKLVHAGLFAVQAWLLCASRRGAPTAGWLAGCFALAVAFGALTEAVQAPIAGRTAELADLGADAVGAAAGVAAFAWRSGRRRRLG